MPSTTPIYHFPYPNYPDAADGPAGFQSLALAVEGSLNTSDTSSARLPRGIIGGNRYAGDGWFVHGLTPAFIPLNMATGPVALQANRRYHIHAKWAVAFTQLAQVVIVQIRENSASGPIRAEMAADAANLSILHTFQFSGDRETTSAETVNFLLCGQAIGGYPNILPNDSGVWMLVEDVGPAGKVTYTTPPFNP